MLDSVKIAYVGFGVVSQGLAEILNKRDNMLPDQTRVLTVGIIDTFKGSKIDENGIEMGPLLERCGAEDYSLFSDRIDDATEVIKALDADVVIEASYTNIETGEPALSHIEAALNSGKHVVTSNKGPFANHYQRIFELAASEGKQVGIEGTVMSGTPLINTLRHGLRGSEIQSAAGILNGTSNYILSQMEDGMTYSEALSKAQDKGYAEADPTNDVEGCDTLAKVMILSHVIFGHQLDRVAIPVSGITSVSIEDVERAKAENKRWKLIGRVWKEGKNHIKGQVSPELVSQADPLYNIMGAVNALKINSLNLGETTISGAGAGRIETGFSLYNDIMSIVKELNREK